MLSSVSSPRFVMVSSPGQYASPSVTALDLVERGVERGELSKRERIGLTVIHGDDGYLTIIMQGYSFH
jgi:hypothetical protein